MRSLAVVLVAALALVSCRKQATEPAERSTAEAPVPEVPDPPKARAYRPEQAERPRGCTTALVQAVVKPRRDDVTRCYRKALAAKPNAAGKLAVEIHIDGQGEAKFLGVQTDDIGDEAFTRCVFEVLRSIEFPLPDQAPCVVVYPFVFSAR